MRTRQDDIFSLIDAANTLARRTPAQSEAVFNAIYGPSIRAAERQQLIDQTLAEARAEYRASQARMATQHVRHAPAAPMVSLEDVLLSGEGVELAPVEGATPFSDALGLGE